MRLFSPLYEKAMQWARHRYAPGYLAGLSFAESSFFPIPPDVMLAPMSLAKPKQAWRLAALTTIASVLGGLLGYAIGLFAFEQVAPLLQDRGYWQHYLTAKSWFDEWGVWAIFIAGFSPIPYKVFTISAGAVSMALLPFAIASLIGRGGRFFLVAALMAWGGERMEEALGRYMDLIGWLVVLLVVILLVIFKL
ncbi:MAG: DedA family protein [Candidatus Polarisedimenticolaceae bacterium]|nr:DedA family protein [Candidatus Polarisedimenticolaceae bacterium]